MKSSVNVLKGLFGPNGLSSPHGFYLTADSTEWPAPTNGQPGGWVYAPDNHPEKAFEPHEYGLHGALAHATVSWMGKRNFIMECTDIKSSSEVTVAKSARLVSELFLSRENAAQLCTKFLQAVSAFPHQVNEEILKDGFPFDQYVAIQDTQKHLNMMFDKNATITTRYPTRDPSPLSYLKKQLGQLVQRCTNDELRSEEGYLNVAIMNNIAKASLSALSYCDGTNGPDFEHIRAVSFHCRRAVHAMCMNREYHKIEGDFYEMPELLRAFVPEGQDEDFALNPERARRTLQAQQSKMLNDAWGIGKKLPELRR